MDWLAWKRFRYGRGEVIVSCVSITRDRASFLGRLAGSTSNNLPDRNECHLLLFRKRYVYELFQAEYPKLRDGSPHKMRYFGTVWKQSCWWIKVRNIRRFCNRSLCAEFKSVIRHSIILRGINRTVLNFIQHSDHKIEVREREEYHKSRDRAFLRPEDHISIIIDGTD